VLVMIIAAAAHFVPDRWYTRGLELYCQFPYYAQAAVIAALAVAIRYVAGSGSAPFIYSRF
jgi:alginate O-acetyltransferase complex protein AlgI